MERLGVGVADIDLYLASKPSLASEANPLEALITEKYVSNFLQAEVWHDWRRTGYPDVPLVESCGALPGGDSTTTPDSGGRAPVQRGRYERCWYRYFAGIHSDAGMVGLGGVRRGPTPLGTK